jgi:MoaA/NifB/PqqE/SkfB family radical SAM enzyme
MCYFSSVNNKKMTINPMSVDVFSKIANNIFSRTRMLFLGCGAEPLMSPNFVEYVNIIGSYNIPFVSLVTNGQLLSKEISECLINNKVNEVIVSVDGVNPNTYESIRKGGKYERLMQNLSVLKELKDKIGVNNPEIRFNFTAMRKNIGELNDLVEIAKDFNVNTIRVRYMGDWGGAIDFESESLGVDEYYNFVKEAKSKAKFRNIDLLYEGCFDLNNNINISGKIESYRPYECILPWYSIIIRGDGESKCCSWQKYGQGNLIKNDFLEYQNSDNIKKIKYLLAKDPCKSCLTVCKKQFGGL